MCALLWSVFDKSSYFTIHPKERYLNVAKILIHVWVSVNFIEDIV